MNQRRSRNNGVSVGAWIWHVKFGASLCYWGIYGKNATRERR